MLGLEPQLGGRADRDPRMCSRNDIEVKQPCADAGFGLVELLVALALGMLLLTAVTRSVLATISDTHVAEDYAEMVERQWFAVQQVSEAVADTVPVSAVSSASACLTSMRSVGIIVAPAQSIACVSDDARGAVLIVEPQHSLTALSSPLEDATADPCTAACRQVFFWRDWSWQRGDGLGALMRAEFDPTNNRFKRAEMLVPGMDTWVVQPIFAAVDCEQDRQIPGCDLVVGARVEFTVRGWLIDAAGLVDAAVDSTAVGSSVATSTAVSSSDTTVEPSSSMPSRFDGVPRKLASFMAVSAQSPALSDYTSGLGGVEEGL